MIKDKIIVITGAGGVICSEIAKFLAKKGGKIALLDVNFENAEKIASEIRKDNNIARAYECDVLSVESLLETKNKINNELGKIDILINGAGGNHKLATTDNEYQIEGIKDIKTFFELEKEGIEFVFDLNILGTILPTQIFSKDMVEKKEGAILNISSMSSYNPLTKIPAYSAAKSSVNNFTKWCAVYFSKMNIRCNAIAPGFLRTKQNEKLLFNVDNTPTERTLKILKNTPMERFVLPEELNYSVEFLINNDKSSAITGIILPIDAGFSAYSGV